MGIGQSTPDLHEQLIDLRLNAKMLERQQKKCEANRTKQLKNVKKAIEQNNPEGAAIYAQNAIRERHQGLTYLRLAARLDAVAARIDTAITTQQVTAQMGPIVSGMKSAIESMDVEQISKTMTKFEEQFEDMDVVAGYMEGAMDSSTATLTPQDEVDGLIRQVADEHNLEVGAMLDEAGAVGTQTPSLAQQEAASQRQALQTGNLAVPLGS